MEEGSPSAARKTEATDLQNGSILPQITQMDTDKSVSHARFVPLWAGGTQRGVFIPAGFLRILKSGGIACHTLKAFSPMYGNEDKSISRRSLRPRTSPVKDRMSGREKYFIRVNRRDIRLYLRQVAGLSGKGLED